MLHQIFKRACSSRVSKFEIEIGVEIMHKRLSYDSRHILLTASDVKLEFQISSRNARAIVKDFKTVDSGDALENLANLSWKEQNHTYIPTGTICRNDLLEYLAGVFDGDGCVGSYRNYSRLRVQQRSHFVNLFHLVFGGCINLNNATKIWEINGIRAYVASKILVNYAEKKKAEMLLLIHHQEGKISDEEFHLSIRNLKDNYHQQEFDVSRWSYAFIAGWIDSDGTISIRRNGSPLISLAQKNEHVCRSFANRFGGFVVDSRGKNCNEWRLEGIRAYELICRIQPHLRHKKDHASLLIKNDGYLKGDHIKHMRALNTQNNAYAWRRFVERYGQYPEEYL